MIKITVTLYMVCVCVCVCVHVQLYMSKTSLTPPCSIPDEGWGYSWIKLGYSKLMQD